MRRAAGIGMAALVLLVAACADKTSDTSGSGPVASASSNETDPPAPTSVPSPTTPAVGPCTTATTSLVETISGHLSGEGVHLTEAFVTTDAAGHTIVMANITDAQGQRLSSADTWIVDGPTIYALSSSARQYSTLPDGRDLPGVDFGDPAIAAAEACLIAAT